MRYIEKKEITPLETVRAYLSRIEKFDPKLNSYITVLADEAEQAAKDFYYYIAGLIEEKSKNPQNDMISRLSVVTENDQKLTVDQIVCTVILLLNAGHEATVNTIGNSSFAFLYISDLTTSNTAL